MYFVVNVLVFSVKSDNKFNILIIELLMDFQTSTFVKTRCIGLLVSNKI